MAIAGAAFLYVLLGVAVPVSNLLIVIGAQRTGRLPEAFGIEFLAGPISERLGLDPALAGTIPWAAVSLLEAAARAGVANPAFYRSWLR